LKFLPGSDGQLYVTGSWDNCVGVWDCRSGKRERHVQTDLALVGSGPEALDVWRGGSGEASVMSSVIMTASYRPKEPVQLFELGSCRQLGSIDTASVSTYAEDFGVNGNSNDATEVFGSSNNSSKNSRSSSKDTSPADSDHRVNNEGNSNTTNSNSTVYGGESAPLFQQTQNKRESGEFIPYCCNFSKNGKIRLGGKFLNENTGCFSVFSSGTFLSGAGSPKRQTGNSSSESADEHCGSYCTYTDVSLPATVWSSDGLGSDHFLALSNGTLAVRTESQA
jgi:hypothetical protein